MVITDLDYTRSVVEHRGALYSVLNQTLVLVALAVIIYRSFRRS